MVRRDGRSCRGHSLSPAAAVPELLDEELQCLRPLGRPVDNASGVQPACSSTHGPPPVGVGNQPADGGRFKYSEHVAVSR